MDGWKATAQSNRTGSHEGCRMQRSLPVCTLEEEVCLLSNPRREPLSIDESHTPMQSSPQPFQKCPDETDGNTGETPPHQTTAMTENDDHPSCSCLARE